MVFSKYLNWNSDWWQRHLLLLEKNQENWHWLHCWEETIPVIIYVNQCTMHICGMDFSSLASYWQIKAFLNQDLMLEPSVVTPQNQYFPANSERMSVHCLESGCIGKYTHLGPRDFPRVGILHPSALGKSLGPRGVYFPIHPSSGQCTDIISESVE